MANPVPPGQYGYDFNFTCYAKAPDEAAARVIKKGGASTKEEERKLKDDGKYYKPGEGAAWRPNW